MNIKKNNREKGNIGEDIACSYIEKKGFFVQDRNYLKKWGEIDIVAIKDGIVHFMEVKSSFVKWSDIGYRPEENVHNIKIKRLKRVIQTYLNDKKYGNDIEFKFHVITVSIDKITGKSIVNMLENIIL